MGVSSHKRGCLKKHLQYTPLMTANCKETSAYIYILFKWKFSSNSRILLVQGSICEIELLHKFRKISFTAAIFMKMRAYINFVKNATLNFNHLHHIS